MAYFQVTNPNTNELINVHVGEIQILDEVKRSKTYDLLTGIYVKSNNVLIRQYGDDIFQLFGKDSFENNIIYPFVNFPKYGLKTYINSVPPGAQTFYTDPTYQYIEGGAAANYYHTEFIWYAIDLVEVSSKSTLTRLWYTFEPTTYIGPSKDGPISSTIYMYNQTIYTDSSAINYRNRIAFDFNNKVITMFSPYVFKGVKSLSRPEAKISALVGNPYAKFYFTPYKLRDRGLYMPAVGLYYGLSGTTQQYGIECINSNNIKQGYYYNYTGSNENVISVTIAANLPEFFIYPLIETIQYNPNTDTFSNLRSTGNNFQVNSGISSSFFLDLNQTRYYGYNAIYQLLFNKENDTTPYPTPDPTTPSDPNKPLPDYNGGNGNQDSGSDDIVMEDLPIFNAITTGSVKAYSMTKNTLEEFFNYIWDNKFFTAIIKLFTNPFDAIISLHILPFVLKTSSTAGIKVGNVNTSVEANVISTQYITLDCGSISILPFYNDSSDYESIFHVYLLGVGYVQLNTYEIMNSILTLKYNIDVVTGDCIAYINVQNTMNNFNSTMYQQAGNLAHQIPLSSYDYSSIISASLGLIGAGRNVATQMGKKKVNTTAVGLGLASSIIDAALSVDITLDKASNLAGNNIMLSQKQCYITRTSVIHNMPTSFAKNVGYPISATYQLSQCKGYTKCQSVHVDNIIGTREETEEIYRLLISGVIF